jgi:hypothetical protein
MNLLHALLVAEGSSGQTKRLGPRCLSSSPAPSSVLPTPSYSFHPVVLLIRLYRLPKSSYYNHSVYASDEAVRTRVRSDVCMRVECLFQWQEEVLSLLLPVL